jgi:hypothetical protein
MMAHFLLTASTIHTLDAERAEENEDDTSALQAREALETCLSILHEMAETWKIALRAIAVINRFRSRRDSAAATTQANTRNGDEPPNHEMDGTNFSGIGGSPEGQFASGEIPSSFAGDLNRFDQLPLSRLNPTPYSSSNDIASYMDFGLNDVGHGSVFGNSNQNVFQDWYARTESP